MNKLEDGLDLIERQIKDHNSQINLLEKSLQHQIQNEVGKLNDEHVRSTQSLRSEFDKYHRSKEAE